MASSMHSKRTFSYKQIQNPATLLSLLRQTAAGSGDKRPKSRRVGGGLLKVFKLLPLLSSGCKMVALLGRAAGHRKSLIADHATIVTILSHRRGGKVTIAIQETPHGSPAFVIDLPIYSPAFQREMEGDILRVAFESETKKSNAGKKKLLEEMVWAVYCNGRKIGYSVRRKEMSEEEAQVMRLLKGVSMGAGVLPCRRPEVRGESPEGEMTYLRARFERVVGSNDSQAMYMINPDGSHDGPELSIFFLRVR